MTTNSSHAKPPAWMQAAVSVLLPPAYREPVLGDLEERFGERGAGARWIGYAADVATTVPQVLRSQVRRVGSAAAPCAAGVAGDLRSRAEQLQTQIWIRNGAILVSVVLLIGGFLINAGGAWGFHESVTLAMTIGWMGATWRSYGVRGRSTVVPASLAWEELRAFHRGEIRRQMDLGWREFVYWCVPAVLLIVCGMAVAALSTRTGLMLLGALVMQNGVIAWVHGFERRRYRRELERLEQEVEPV